MTISKNDFKIIYNHMKLLSYTDNQRLIQQIMQGKTTVNEINNLITKHSSEKVVKLMGKINRFMSGGSDGKSDNATSSVVSNSFGGSATSSAVLESVVDSATSNVVSNSFGGSATSSAVLESVVDSATSSVVSNSVGGSATSSAVLESVVDSATSNVVSNSVGGSETSSAVPESVVNSTTSEMLMVEGNNVDSIKDSVREIIDKLKTKSDLLKEKEIQLAARENDIKIKEEALKDFTTNIEKLEKIKQQLILDIGNISETTKSTSNTLKEIKLEVGELKGGNTETESGFLSEIFS
jgi:hypothetical protein